MSSYPRGSTWRRWDLHIHTPKSIIQEYGGDNKNNWDEFIRRIAALPADIKVLGINDYLFCDGYEYLLTRRNEIPNIELVIPNIEFRLNTFSGTAHSSRRHNFHVMFDPTVSIDDIRGQFLNCLATGYKIQDKAEWRQTPTPRSLSELGRQIKSAAPAGNTIHSKSDLEVGFDNITYKREDILELLKKSCFKGKFITAIGYSEWDQSRWDQSAAEKRDLINNANFSLTCLADPAKISEHRTDLIRNKLNSIILQSSDAHTFGAIGRTLLWIKADPSFAGLKQILNEPDSRVFIGDTPPNYKPEHSVISMITIPASNGWFANDFRLELNSDLVTIIGGRGSGKSALAEAIAYGAGSKDSRETAFLRKAAKHKSTIVGTRIFLDWGDGEKTDFAVGELQEDQGRVQYLPQSAVEELCSPDNSEKLRKQIENVIFQALDETKKMGASDFEELRARILRDYQYEKEHLVVKIRDMNSKLSALINTMKASPEKEKQLGEKKEELKKLLESLPKLPPEDKRGQEELAKLLEIKKNFETLIINFQSSLARISEIEAKIKVFKRQVEEYQEEMGALLLGININNPEAFLIKIDEEEMKRVLDAKKAEILGQVNILNFGAKAQVAALLSIAADELPFDNLQTLSRGIVEKQNATRAFETTKLKYQQQKKIAFDLENYIRALEAEIQKVKTEVVPARKQLSDARMEAYCYYFELLRTEKLKIEELYKPLQDTLSMGSETDRKLLFEAQINHRLAHQIKVGLEIIDRTRRGNFRESNSLKNAFGEMAESIAAGDYDKGIIERAVLGIIQKFTNYEDEKITIEDQLRDNKTIEDFTNWLFDPSYFEIVTSLKFNGTDLYLLSPGQKGIILLMLYLEIDNADYRPLIIDQPEENLDNLSVYKDLIGYFRNRKRYRQIIMVTHNPNLVVNTDAEQIIVANYNGEHVPMLNYCSGSLEDEAQYIPSVAVDALEDGIIDQVCNILEGGEHAFVSRKRKYQLSVKSQIK